MIFIDWYLPGYRAGGPIQSIANLVGRLPYHFWIITSRYDHRSAEPYPGIPTGEWVSRRPNEQVMYLERGALTSELLDRVLAERTFHLFYINSLFSREFALIPLRHLRKRRLTSKVILAPRGMLKSGALSVKARKKKVFLFLSQKLGWFRNITWHATNPTEADEIKKHFPYAQDIRIAPNLPRQPHARFERTKKQRGVLKLISVARVSKEKNIAGGIAYLNATQGAENIVWDIYGTMEDQHYLEHCQQMAKNGRAEINFKGEIAPNEIPERLSQYDFFYLPTLGENFGHAIAEALLSGLPVIISNKTPWNHVEEHHAGWALPLETEAFTSTLSKCVEMDEASYLAVCKGAQALGRLIAEDPAGLEANVKLFS